MRNLLVCLCAALLLPVSARAQFDSEAAAPLEDKPAVQINEIERGLYIGLSAGGMLLFGPEAKAGSGLSTGQHMAISIGYDLSERLSLGLMVLGTHVNTPAAFITESNMGGDFSAQTIGALARVAVLSRPDENGINRLFVDLHAGAGLGLMGPKNFYPGSDIVLLGGAGVEWFTRLRHFSVGIDADFLFGISNMGPGLMLSPKLRYSF